MNVDTVTDALMQHLKDEIECQMIDDRLVCDTALYYPDGDSVVYVTDHQGIFEVTDYSEGTSVAMQRLNKRSATLLRVGDQICHDLGLAFLNGRISANVSGDNLGDAVWRVATASLQLADAVGYELAKPERAKKDFTEEVARELAGRGVDIQRNRRIIGASGHEHKPSIFVVSRNTVIEPVASEAMWTRAAAVYAQFGDLMHANGYGRVALIDDRGEAAKEDAQNLLQQVSSLVYWTSREPWLERVAG